MDGERRLRFHLVRIGLAAPAFAALLGLLAADAAAQASVTFELVPEARWNGGSPPPGSLLEDGTVRLYEVGAYAPAVVGLVGIPVVVPPGTWTWIAESEGWVSVVGSTLEVPDRPSATSLPKTIVWPVVPACTLRLTGRWTGVERLDAVSLTSGATFPLPRPAEGNTLRVPAGGWLVYGVRGGRLTGLGDPERCSQGDEIDLASPSLPGADRQDLMLQVQLPEGMGSSTQPLEVAASAPRGAAYPPTASARSGKRLRTFFFHDLPAREPLDLTVVQPLLRTARHPLSPGGGSAREVKLQLRERSALVFEVDYRPRREHHRQEIELLRCDGARHAPDDCVKVAHRPLAPGFARYRFDAVDDGEYAVNAAIDDELVLGLGANLWPDVLPDSDDVVRPPAVILEEMEIWGHLLADSEPVEGTLRLVPRSGAAAVRQASTEGESLVYHLFYFAQQPDASVRPLLPDELQDLGDDELRGLFGWYEIQGCDAAGRCRSLPLRSLLIGSGRLDLDLGDSRGLDLELVDAATGKPLPRVPVLVRGGEESRLVFYEGEQWWLPKAGGEASPRRTDSDGVARIRDLDPGPVSWSVKQDGYRAQRGAANVPPRGTAKVRVELERDEGAGDFELLWPGGGPVAGAYVLVFEPAGPRRPSCVGSSNPQGGVDLRRGCLAGSRLIILHPESRIALVDGDQLAESRTLTLEPTLTPPPVLRVVDEAGRPLASVPVWLEVAPPSARDEGPWAIGPTELLGALGRHLQPLFYLTGPDGLLSLRGVDPGGLVPVRVLVGAGRERREAVLAGWWAGEQIEVVLAR